MSIQFNRGNRQFRRTLAVGLLVGSRFAFATTDIYIGGAGTTSWSTTTNWSESHAPNAAEDASIKFNDSTVRTVNLDVTSNSLNSLTLDQTGTGALTFTQSAAVNLTATTVAVGFSGAATYNQSNGNLTTSTLDISGAPSGPGGTTTSAFNLTGSGKIIINSGGLLKVGDFANTTFSQNGASTNVTLNGSGSEFFIGIGDGSGSSIGTYNFSAGNITNAGSGGTVIVGYSDIGNFNQTGGTLTLTGGTIILGHFADGTGNYTLNGGATVAVQTITVGDAGNANFVHTFGTVTATSALIIGSSAGSTGTYTLLAGSLNAPITTVGQAGVGVFTLNGGTHTVTGTLTIGNVVNSSGTYNMISGTLSAPTENIGGFGSALFNQTGGTNTISVSGQLNIGGSVSDAQYNLHGGIISLSSFSNLNNFGTLDIAGGTINGSGNVNNNSIITGFGSITVSGIFTNTGTITQSSGILTIGNASGAYSNAGEIDLSLPGQLKLPTFFTNNGTINLNGGQLVAGNLLTNSGFIVGPGIITGTFSNSNNGIISVPVGITSLPASTNIGIIQLTSATSQLNTGASLNNSGTIQGIGAVGGSNITNTGTIEPVGGTLIISGSLSNSAGGTLRASSGNKLLILGGLGANSGIISLTGGTFDDNSHILDNTGQITGFGTFSAATLTNDGSVTFTGSGGGGTTTINGSVVNVAGRTINIKFNPAIFTGDITNNGTIKTTSTTVTFTGNYTGNTFISDPATNIFQQNATTLPGGLMTGSTGDIFNFSGGVFTNNGTFTNGGTLQVATAVVNNGTFSQSGPQTWSTGATFTNNAGIATFASNAKLYGLTINGGTVDIIGSKFIIEATALTKSAMLASLQGDIATHALISSGMPSNFGLALLDNAALNKTTFGGNPADSNSLLLSAELLGDANADGHVDLTDLSTILNNFGASTPNWTSGNFDNQSTIDLTDLSDVLNNFGLTNPNATTSRLQITDYGLQTAPAPEPASLALLLLPAVLLGRRHRN